MQTFRVGFFCLLHKQQKCLKKPLLLSRFANLRNLRNLLQSHKALKRFSLIKQIIQTIKTMFIYWKLRQTILFNSSNQYIY